MKKCAYCGRDNSDEALNCHECGTEFEPPREAPVAEEPEPTLPSYSVKLSAALDSLKTIASLEVEVAEELLARLQQEGIPAEAQPAEQEGGLDYRNILVEDGNYERACDVAEAWEAHRQAAAERRSNRFCPSCGSRKLAYVGTETFGSIWKCQACGNDFAQ